MAENFTKKELEEKLAKLQEQFEDSINKIDNEYQNTKKKILAATSVDKEKAKQLLDSLTKNIEIMKTTLVKTKEHAVKILEERIKKAK